MVKNMHSIVIESTKVVVQKVRHLTIKLSQLIISLGVMFMHMLLMTCK
jgi:hypothetical protein